MAKRVMETTLVEEADPLTDGGSRVRELAVHGCASHRADGLRHDALPSASLHTASSKAVYLGPPPLPACDGIPLAHRSPVLAAQESSWACVVHVLRG